MKFREIHLPSVDSTIGYAQAHKGEFDPDCLTLISADEQTAGKGTQGRSFSSPKGGLYLSFCSTLPKGFSEPQFAAQILALATLEAIRALDLDPKLKWPNDLLLGGKKAAGFLAMISDEEDHLLLINSVGLNVNSEEIMVDQPTTTLKAEIGSPLDCQKLKKDICTRYQKNLLLFLEKGFTPFLADLKKALGLAPDAVLEPGMKDKKGKSHVCDLR